MDRIERTKKYGGYTSIKVANMEFILQMIDNKIMLSIKSYATKIMYISFDDNFNVTESYFNTRVYSRTTTHHQGIAAAIYVDLLLVYIHTEDRRKYIINIFNKTTLEEFPYMSISERKYWKLV